MSRRLAIELDDEADDTRTPEHRAASGDIGGWGPSAVSVVNSLTGLEAELQEAAVSEHLSPRDALHLLRRVVAAFAWSVRLMHPRKDRDYEPHAEPDRGGSGCPKPAGARHAPRARGSKKKRRGSR